MIAPFFNAWERRLASVDTDRVVREFDWGLEWLDLPADGSPLEQLKGFAQSAMADSDQFFSEGRTTDYELDGDELRFPSALTSPYELNNTVVAPPAGFRQRANDTMMSSESETPGAERAM